uniref:Uncharacterized protein n=1 Tax=Parascaris univalens TaxID=6257 RepID=A0A915BSX3_PARUN
MPQKMPNEMCKEYNKCLTGYFCAIYLVQFDLKFYCEYMTQLIALI